MSPTTPAPASQMTPPERGVKVRMYRTGLGDCFLLAFPRESASADPRDKVFYLLIDCGVYFGTPEPGNKTRIAAIVGDIRDATGGRLDLLVISHEHWDHVSAFHQKQSQALFRDEIALGRLWMAWTENLALPLAKDLHEGRKAARTALLNGLARMEAMGVQSDGVFMVRQLLSFFGGPVDPAPDAPGARQPGLGAAEPFGAAPSFGARKSVQTEEAMEWIREVYGKGKTDFLHPGAGPLAFDGVPDARVYVLGPPEDPQLIRRSDPLGDEVYPKAMAAAMETAFLAAFGVVRARPDATPDAEDLEEARGMSFPFDESLQIQRSALEEALKGGEAAAAKHPHLPFFRDRYLAGEDWRRIDGDWFDAAGELALQLDNATNNTSLAFAIEIGEPGAGKVLLFPADAQVGNWLSWFGKVKLGQQELGKEMVWTVGEAADRKVTAEDLLRRTVLYKVGHHGSHNATLREKGLELMGRPDGSGELAALLPVDEHVARDLAHYGEMPLRSLVKELALRTNGRVARNDDGAPPKDELSTLAPIPGAPALSSSFVDVKTDLYFEYTVRP